MRRAWRMRFKLVTFTAFAALAVSCAGARPAFAQELGGQPDRRAQLERRFRQQLAATLKTRLGLSDEQLRRLGEVNARYEEQRRLLVQQERDARMGLRDEMLAGDSANQNRIAQLLDAMIRIQRQRIEIVEREQRDLAAFLTPLQRAKYAAVQEQLRRRIEEMRRQRQEQGRGSGRRGRRPGF